MKHFVLRIALVMSISTPLLIVPAQAAPYFVQCYDFGCKTTRELHFKASQWDQIRAIFQHGTDSAAEKQAIREAVAMMESFSGELTDTRYDKGGNYPGSDIPGQMDCIDESTNTFQYLSALQELDLMQWHRVDIKHRRIVWFATHWTAVIAENHSNQLFAVDSWYRDNGEPPYIQKLEDWEDKDDFPVEYNPD